MIHTSQLERRFGLRLSVLRLLFICILVKGSESFTTLKPEVWTGRWLPERTTETPHNLTDPKHGIVMGVPSVTCDDAKTNLTVDWDYSPVNYTCYSPNQRFIPNIKIAPLIEKENIPKFYMARHYCMKRELVYDRDLPTFGPHRPLWPVYGEYRFVPRQRWLHSLEHGAIVMLYHPCADPTEVENLKLLVKSCLRRHVISPYTLLDPKRPLALLAWGWRMTMSTVQPTIVEEFIKLHALQGPEHISRDGQFDTMLETKAEIVSTFEDDILCPKH